MAAPDNDKNADQICRDRYRFLVAEIHQHGFDLAQLARSATEFSRTIDGERYLKQSAFAPTGVALGCPLPDTLITERLWRLAKSVDNQVKDLIGHSGLTFAYVPPSHYHITLVNRTHFELSSAITGMGKKGKSAVKELLVQQKWEQIEIRLNGLILTHWGRLFVPGYPLDDSLFGLRAAIAAAVPELRANIPNTAHIKLGHVIAPLRREKTELLVKYVQTCGDQINVQLIFDEVYTPAGRIRLNGSK